LPLYRETIEQKRIAFRRIWLRPGRFWHCTVKWSGHDKRGTAMLYYALVFFIIAIIAAVLGFGGIAAGAAGIAKVLFYIFAIIFVISLIMGLVRR